MAALSEMQADELWVKGYEAEVRSLYFADMGASYARRRQIITGMTFFLSSDAFATVLGKSPTWVPAVLALVSALATAYSMAVGLDKKAEALAKLRASWNQIEEERRQLWHHWYEDDAAERLRSIEEKAVEVSRSSVTDAPDDRARLRKWEQFVSQELMTA